MDCLFCKIIAGEIPATKIYEDEKTFAFLDINPVNPGHTLIIPKKHSENIFDIEKQDLCAIAETSKKIAQAIKKGLNPDGINIINNNQPAAGQVIFHYHTHIIPRFENDGFKHWHGSSYKEGEENSVVEKIKNSL